MIDLINLLIACGIPLATDEKKTKVHLACHNGIEHPLNVYFAGDFDQWQGSQTNRNFACEQVLALIDLGNKEWLFVGVYEVLGEPEKTSEGRFIYETKLLPGQEEVIARVVVRFVRSRASYIWFKPDIKFPVVEVKRKKLSIADFPGYNSVLISWAELKIITQQQIASWRAALSNVCGIYLITDVETGKHYVGKADGVGGVWQRWCDYAKNGHGGNTHLKALLSSHGAEYARNFQYSILEIADSHASEKDILARESHWMQVMKTREFGLN